MNEPATVHIQFELDRTTALASLTLPPGVDRRLQALLDQQDLGEGLTEDERAEAEGLVDLADLLTLMRLRVVGVRAAQHTRPGDRVELRELDGGLGVKRVPLTIEEERRVWGGHLDEINTGARSQIDDDQVDP